MDKIILAVVLGAGFWGIAKATKGPETVDVVGHETSVAEPAGATLTSEAIHAQDARENGFLYNGSGRYSGNLFSNDMKVVNPNPVHLTNFTAFKNTLSADESAFTLNNLKGIFDHDYHRMIPPNSQQKMPLISIPFPGAEVRSGQNVGSVNLLSSNPFAMAQNGSSSSAIRNNEGWVTSQTYGTTSQLLYDRNGEVRMSFSGLRNPWRTGGSQYNLHSAYTPADKDQLTGNVPLAHPRNIFDVGNRPTSVVAPPQMLRTANVQNRQVRLGRTH